jgi:hypothetical protein
MSARKKEIWEEDQEKDRGRGAGSTTRRRRESSGSDKKKTFTAFASGVSRGEVDSLQRQRNTTNGSPNTGDAETQAPAGHV